MRAKTHAVSFVIIISAILLVFSGNSFAQLPEGSGPPPEGSGRGPSKGRGPDAVSSASVPVTDLKKITLNGVEFMVDKSYQFFTWKALPSDVEYERMPVKEFTNPDGVTHYYEVVYLPSGNLNWFQAAYLAQEAGGYLACPTSEEENTFIFNLIKDRKFFWFFPPFQAQEGGRGMNHGEIGMGPWLGGYQPKGSPEPDGGWIWMSGEEMVYKNWAKNLDDGFIDRDPRNNTQPNDSGNMGGQRIMGFGELNEPVPTWGDYMDGTGGYGTGQKHGASYGIVIEYESNPKR